MFVETGILRAGCKPERILQNVISGTTTVHRKRYTDTSYTKTVIKIGVVSSTHFVSNIRHQQRC